MEPKINILFMSVLKELGFRPNFFVKIIKVFDLIFLSKLRFSSKRNAIIDVQENLNLSPRENLLLMSKILEKFAIDVQNVQREMQLLMSIKIRSKTLILTKQLGRKP